MLKLVSMCDINYDALVEYAKAFMDKTDVSFIVLKSLYLKEKEYLSWLKEITTDTCYLLINDENPNYIIGNCVFNTRFDYHDEHCNRGSIGYSIRPNERNKHYGTYILSLMLKKCQESGIKEVCVSCLKNNISSKKIIENNGGKLEKEFYDVWGHDTGLKYWIDLDNENQIKQ